jgi:hypothetical protein
VELVSFALVSVAERDRGMERHLVREVKVRPPVQVEE